MVPQAMVVESRERSAICPRAIRRPSDVDRRNRHLPSYRIALILAQGDLPLTIGYASGMQVEYEAIAARIRALLKLSPSSSDLLLISVGAALEQGRKLDAIRLVCHHRGLSLTEAKRFVEQLPHTCDPPLLPVVDQPTQAALTSLRPVDR
jgi:hypothetical protein